MKHDLQPKEFFMFTRIGTNRDNVKWAIVGKIGQRGAVIYWGFDDAKLNEPNTRPHYVGLNYFDVHWKG